eukprot:10959949-Prorocentrum_lima.AAC.1
MTSSLVGSEMCIRDRGCPDLPILKFCFVKPGTIWKIRKAVYGLKESPRPVSYTHLTLPTICSV